MSNSKWSYGEFASKKNVWVTCLIVIFTCIVAKMFTGCVSITGGSIYSTMVSDYWNFGKELLGEKILYVDIVDHKGFYLYQIYSFFVLISNNNIVIIVFLETLVFAATIGAFYWYEKDIEIGEKCKNKRVVALFPTSMFALLYLVSTSFETNLLNTEGLSIIAIIIVWGILKKRKVVSWKMFFVLGVVLGILFNFKITSIATYIPLFVYACAKHIKNNGGAKMLTISISVGIVSFVLINVPFITYLIENKNLGKFIEVYSYACEGRGDTIVKEIFISLLFLVVAILYLYIFQDNERFYNILICVSMIAFSVTFGRFISYYLAFYIAIMLLELFCYEHTHIEVIIVITIIMTLQMFLRIFSIMFDDFYSKKSVAEEYNITNENILYIWEDGGYGVYSSDLYIEPYQWVPDMMFSSEEFVLFYKELTIERLKNKQFEYVYTYPLEMIEKNNERT